MQLNDWLAHCTQHGLPVGLRERLLAHLLVQRLRRRQAWPDSLAERLALLAPLLCHSPEQQATHAQLVAQQLQALGQAPAAELTRRHAGRAGGTAGPGVRAPAWQRRGQALLLLLLLPSLLWLLGRITAPAVVAPEPAASAPVTRAPGGLQIDPNGSAPAPPLVAPAAAVYVRAQHMASPAADAPSWVAPLRSAVAVLVLCSALFTAWRLWRRQRRRLYAEADSVPEDQVIRQLLRDPQARSLAPRPRALRHVSRLLRQRVVSDSLQLDLRATVQASVRRGGQLALRFVPRSRLPEYLALIERSSERDHQSRYHETLLAALAQRGVPIELFFYRHSPGEGCWRLGAEPGGDGADDSRAALPPLRLDTLLARYPRHRLLVFGDAAAAVHPATGAPADWTAAVKPMAQRTWFTPLPLPDWGPVEAWVTSAQGLDFLLLPMEEAALLTWADWLASGRLQFQADPQAPASHPPLLRDAPDAWALRSVAPPAAVQQRLLAELRAYLGPQGLQWLAACAIFPLLAWPFTLALGRQLQAIWRPAGAVADTADDDAALALGVGALAALPWFRHGRLPDWLRGLLLAELPAATEQRLRDEISRRLAQSASGQGEVLATVAKLRGLLRRAQGPLADVLLLRFLEPALAPRLAQALPEALRRWLFPHGAALLGLRPGLAWAAALPMLLGGLWLPGVWQALAPADRLPLRTMQATPMSLSLAAFALAPDGRTSARVPSGIPVTASLADIGKLTAAHANWPVAVVSDAGVGLDLGPSGQMAVLTGQLNPASGQLLIRQTDQATGQVRERRVDLATTPTALAAAFAAERVYAGDVTGAITAVSLDQPTSTRLTADTQPVRALAAHPDGSQIASLGASGSLRLWRTRPVDGQGPVQHTLAVAAAPLWGALAYSPDGQTLAASLPSGGVVLIDPVTGAKTATWPTAPEHDGVPLTALAYSPDGARLAAGNAMGQVVVWDTASGAPLLRLIAAAAVRSLHYSADSATLWSLDAVGRLQRAGRTPALVAAVVLGCEASSADGSEALDSRVKQIVDALSTPAARGASLTDMVDVVGMGQRSWRAWGHGSTPPQPGEVLVPPDAAAQTAAPLLLAGLQTAAAAGAARTPGSGADSGRPDGIWRLRTVASGLRTITIAGCQATPPAPATEVLNPVDWPSAAADASRQQQLRSALDSLWQPQRSARAAVADRLIAQADLLSDLLPLALARAQGLADGKDPGSPDADSRITQVLRLANATSAVALQRHGNAAYRLMARVQGLSPEAASQSQALRRRLLGVVGVVPQVQILLPPGAEAALRTSASSLRRRLRQQNIAADLGTQTGTAPAQPSVQVLGRSDRALARWLAGQLPRPPVATGGAAARPAVVAQAALPGDADTSDVYQLLLADAPAAQAAQAPSAPASGVLIGTPASGSAAPAVATPASATAQSLRPGTRFRDCPDEAICPWLVVLPAGSFMMGSPAGEVGQDSDEGRQHRVQLARPLAWMETEVTVALFSSFARETKFAADANCSSSATFDNNRTNISWDNPGFADARQTAQHPVVCSSWNDAVAFARWLSAKTGQAYRLPTEAEWEYAARAGSQGRFSFGDDVGQFCRHGNIADLALGRSSNFAKGTTALLACDDGQTYTAPVRSYLPNAFGLYDMHGNVWEWVQDCMHGSYNGAPTDGSAWVTDCGSDGRRVLRGGSFVSEARFARLAQRDSISPTARQSNWGFRLVRELPR